VEDNCSEITLAFLKYLEIGRKNEETEGRGVTPKPEYGI
jgi:hypothetical protein